ncbi:Cationic amino acid transporter 1-like protein [Drosera capensis]
MGTLRLLNAMTAKDELSKPKKELLFVQAKLEGKETKPLVDTGATHNFLDFKEAERLGIKCTKRAGLVKVANSSPQEIHGVARDVEVNIGTWTGHLKFYIVPLDSYKIVLGMDFMDKAKAMPLPPANTMFLLEGENPVVVPLIRGRSSKVKTISAMQLIMDEEKAEIGECGGHGGAHDIQGLATKGGGQGKRGKRRRKPHLREPPKFGEQQRKAKELDSGSIQLSKARGDASSERKTQAKARPNARRHAKHWRVKSEMRGADERSRHEGSLARKSHLPKTKASNVEVYFKGRNEEVCDFGGEECHGPNLAQCKARDMLMRPMKMTHQISPSRLRPNKAGLPPGIVLRKLAKLPKCPQGRPFAVKNRSLEETELNEVRARSQHEMKRTLTWWDLIWLGLGVIIGSRIFVLTGLETREAAGPAVIASYVVSGVSAMLTVFCYTEFAVEIPVAGGSFAYLRVELGDFIAFIAAGNIVLECVIGGAAVARSWTSYFATLCNHQPDDFRIIISKFSANYNHLDPIAVGVIAIICVLATLSTKGSSRFNYLASIVHVVIILFVIIAGLMKADTKNYTPFAPFGVRGVFRASAVLFFAYLGFDTVATMAEETKNPGRDIPIGLVGSMIIAAFAYCLMALTLCLMQPYYQVDPNAPFSVAFEKVGMGWAKYIVAAGALKGMTTVCSLDPSTKPVISPTLLGPICCPCGSLMSTREPGHL